MYPFAGRVAVATWPTERTCSPLSAEQAACCSAVLCHVCPIPAYICSLHQAGPPPATLPRPFKKTRGACPFACRWVAEAPLTITVGNFKWVLYLQTRQWFTANTFCRLQGGNLLAVRDANAQANLTAFLANQGAAVASAWIGLTTKDQRSSVNASKWTFTANGQSPDFGWGTGQPDGGPTFGGCAQVSGNQGEIGTWNDVDCLAYAPVICEFGEHKQQTCRRAVNRSMDVPTVSVVGGWTVVGLHTQKGPVCIDAVQCHKSD